MNDYSSPLRQLIPVPNFDAFLTMEMSMFEKYIEKNHHVQSSVKVIEDCFSRYDHDPEKFCISFNGGKDCTVLLHLTHMVIQRNRLNFRLKSLHITIPDTFGQLVEFVNESYRRYNLDAIEIEGPDFKTALQGLKNSHPKMDAILMGTRRSDISYQLGHFERTDEDWPQFMRVNPILDWSYRHVWDYLVKLQVPYCKLYDHGYTSIGSTKNTQLNPRLKRLDQNGHTFYLPAFSLEDPSDERFGRISC